MADLSDILPNRFIEGAELVESELDRARRLVVALNNPNDRDILERYIAELETRHSLDIRRDISAS